MNLHFDSSVAYYAYPMSAVPAYLISTGLSPGCSISNIDPFGVPGRAAEFGTTGWIPTHMWET